MAKYMITLITKAPSAAAAVARVAIDANGEYRKDWERITVEEVPKPKYASGGIVGGTIPAAAPKYGTV